MPPSHKHGDYESQWPGGSGFWCRGKHSCGQWNFASNAKCYVCGKVPSHVPVGHASVHPPKGAWHWQRPRPAPQPRRDRDDESQGRAQPTTIQLLTETIRGFKASGLQDPSLVEFMEKKLGDLKKEKHEGKSHWQQARDSETLLARKQKQLEKLKADKAAHQLDIEKLKADVLGIDSKVDTLSLEIKKLEAEASGASGGTSQPILQVLGLSDIPKEVIDLEQSKEHMAKIQEAVRSLAELAKPIQEAKAKAEADAKAAADAAAPPAGGSAAGEGGGLDPDMEVDEGRDLSEGEAEESLRCAAEGVEGITPEVLKRMAAKVASDLQSKRRRLRKDSQGDSPSG